MLLLYLLYADHASYEFLYSIVFFFDIEGFISSYNSDKIYLMNS